MNVYIRLRDYSQLIRPTGPIFAFVFPWIVVLFGQVFPLCDIIIPGFSSFHLIVLGNIITIFSISFFIQTFFPQNLSLNKKTINDIFISKRFKKIVLTLLLVYFSIQLFQVYFFKGIPLLWLFQHTTKVYTDYGFKSLNGFINAIYLLGTTSIFLIYTKERQTRYLFLVLFLLTIPILLVSRQLLMSVFLQITCCLLIYHPKSLKKIFFFSVILLVTFIFVGNMRTGLTHLISILQPKEFIPAFLYPLLWVYAYIVTPFNNIHASIDHIQPIGLPYYEVSSLLPTIFRRNFQWGDIDTGFFLVHPNMTVSTFYFEPLLDYGRFYAFIFMFAFQIVLFLSYRKAIKSSSPIHVIEYSVLYMIMVLSIFSNLFLFLPVITQLLILNIAKLKVMRKMGQLVFAAGSHI